MKPKTRRMLKVTAWVVGSVVVVFGGLIGFAHTKAGRPILAWLGGKGVTGGCPLGLDQGDPVAAEAFRVAELHKREGTAPVAHPRALDFELGTSTKSDVQAWLAARGIQCKDERAGAVLKCLDFPADATSGLAPGSDLHLQFDAAERLVALDLMRPATVSAEAVAAFDTTTGALGRTLGAPSHASGEVSADWLGAEAMRRIAREYRFQGYVASVSATNFGSRGVRVREQYQWAGAAE